MPDRVVTVGQYSAQLLSSDGYDGDRLRVGGALHMQDSMAPQGNAHKLPSQPRHATVLVACAVGLEEAAELVGLASELFQEDEEVDVIVKCHPITSIHGVCKYLGKPCPTTSKLVENQLPNYSPAPLSWCTPAQQYASRHWLMVCRWYIYVPSSTWTWTRWKPIRTYV